MGRAVGLDLVRVGAALSVFLYHGRLFTGAGLGGQVADYGYLGVPVFFALSGYLVYRPFTRGQVDPFDFLLRRAARLVPAAVVALIGVGLLLPGGFPWLFVVLWSLVVEATYYVSLPLFSRVAGRHEVFAVVAVAAASVVFGQAIGTVLLPQMLLAMPLFAPAWWWAFAPGMILALVERDRPDLLRPRFLAVTGLLLLCTGIGVVGLWPAGVPEALRAAPIVLGAVGIMGASLSWRPSFGASAAALAADASYALYLWHAPVLVVVAPVLGGYPGLGAGFVLATTAAAASVLLVERPFRRARLRERRASQASPPA
jgi:peptidoglycan/LPS O-acetylase OafA/YrhL